MAVCIADFLDGKYGLVFGLLLILIVHGLTNLRVDGRVVGD